MLWWPVFHPGDTTCKTSVHTSFTPKRVKFTGLAPGMFQACLTDLEQSFQSWNWTLLFLRLREFESEVESCQHAPGRLQALNCPKTVSYICAQAGSRHGLPKSETIRVVPGWLQAASHGRRHHPCMVQACPRRTVSARAIEVIIIGLCIFNVIQ